MHKSIIRAVMTAAVALGAAVGHAQDTPSASAESSSQKHGYLIANYTIKDRKTYEQYMVTASLLPQKYHGKVIIYDVKSRTLEGAPESVMAVAEFPSVAETERFYRSPEYTAARKLRTASTVGSVLLAEGLPSAAAGSRNGYMIANYTINDPATFKRYMEAAGTLAPKFGGRVIIYDTSAKALEGKPEKITAVAEFASVADTEKFYGSPEYTAARQFRIASTRGSVVLAAGMPQTIAKHRMSKQEIGHFIDVTVDLMTRSNRTPILRTPDEYGMEYEDVFFPAQDGVTLEGWFIPGKSDRLVIMNHPMPANRYGYPGHLKEWNNFGGFEVNFLPEYKVLHDAGYNILTYDMRNHGRSGSGNGGLIGHGEFEYRDVIGSLRYAKSRPDTRNMKLALYSRCLGANSTFVAMSKLPEEFRDIRAMIALQPVTPLVFIERAIEMNGIENGMELFAKAYYDRSGLHLEKVLPPQYAKADMVPTLVAQVHDDFLTKPSNVQAFYDNISAPDKKLFWIEGTDRRFDGYNYFGEHPELVLDWLNSHML